MNAPPWPVNPSIGQMFQNWVWSGSQWIATPTTGMRIITQVFVRDGSYMPSPGLVSVVVECVGGGGAGGSASTANATIAVAGGGGGSGGYARKTVAAALVRGGVPVSIGGGGTGSGEYGGTTTFGALCQANGGWGGIDNDGATTFGDAGNGGGIGLGDIAMPGASGQCGVTAGDVNSSTQGGLGGALFGGNGVDLVGTGGYRIGRDAIVNTGAGGTGGVINHASVPAGQLPIKGGNGGSGLCIVTEYCWGDRDVVKQWSPPVNVNLNWPRPPFPGGGPWPPGPWPRGEDDP